MAHRIFIADPACAISYGHNPTGIGAFAETLSKYFDHTIPLVCRHLPSTVKMPAGTDRVFEFYYREQIALETSVRPTRFRKILERDSRKIRKTIRLFASRRLKLPIIKDPIRSRARKDWANIFRKHRISKTDVIFFTCGDYYGVRGLLHYLRDHPFREWPVIHIHLINVLENECRTHANPAEALLNDLLASGVLGRRLFVSAEVATYSAHLATHLLSDVDNFAFPPLVELAPFVEKDQFIVAAIGSGRGDKGYFRLADIASIYARKYGDDRVKFLVQSMSPDNRQFNPNYETRLEALKNVRKVDHRLSTESIRELYVEADLLLLPYCHRTYRLRGSAVMSEGYGYGRPLLVSKETAFEEVVRRFGNGSSCGTDLEFCEAIHIHAKMPRAALSESCANARLAFVEDYERKMKQLCDRLHSSLGPSETSTTR